MIDIDVLPKNVAGCMGCPAQSLFVPGTDGLSLCFLCKSRSSNPAAAHGTQTLTSAATAASQLKELHKRKFAKETVASVILKLDDSDVFRRDTRRSFCY